MRELDTNLKTILRDYEGLNVIVDWRMELLASIQLIGMYGEIFSHLVSASTKVYKDKMFEYFNKFKSHEAVTLFDEMSNNGFSYDAPPTLMLYLNENLKLSQRYSLSEYIIERSGGMESLNKFVNALADYYEVTHFKKFWDEHQDFYLEMLEEMIKSIGHVSIIKRMQEYYSMSLDSYNIILVPTFSGGFGPSIEDREQKSTHIYSIISPLTEKEGIPIYGSWEYLVKLVWHEFSHSFINPLTNKNYDKINVYKELLKPIAEDMRKMAYVNWSTCVNEHIVRAIVVRLNMLYCSNELGELLLKWEKDRKFIYIQKICGALLEYESNRDTYKTIEDFYPKILEVFESEKC